MILLHRFWRFPWWLCQTHAQPPTLRVRDYTSPVPHPLTYLAWVALPGAYAPASITLLVNGVRKPRLHDKAVVLDGEHGAYTSNRRIQRFLIGKCFSVLRDQCLEGK
jgi:hypothetical protein